MTEEQKIIGREYTARALAAINDQNIFDEVMAEFEEWKKREGIII